MERSKLVYFQVSNWFIGNTVLEESSMDALDQLKKKKKEQVGPTANKPQNIVGGKNDKT